MPLVRDQIAIMIGSSIMPSLHSMNDATPGIRAERAMDQLVVVPRIRALELEPGGPGVLLVDVSNSGEDSAAVVLSAAIHPAEASPWIAVNQPTRSILVGSTELFVVLIRPPADSAERAYSLVLTLEEPDTGLVLGEADAVTVSVRRLWTISPVTLVVQLRWDEWIETALVVTGPPGASARVEIELVTAEPDDVLLTPVERWRSEKFEMGTDVQPPVQRLPDSGTAQFAVRLLAGGQPRSFIVRVYDDNTSELQAQSTPVTALLPAEPQTNQGDDHA